MNRILYLFLPLFFLLTACRSDTDHLSGHIIVKNKNEKFRKATFSINIENPFERSISFRTSKEENDPMRKIETLDFIFFDSVDRICAVLPIIPLQSTLSQATCSLTFPIEAKKVYVIANRTNIPFFEKLMELNTPYSKYEELFLKIGSSDLMILSDDRKCYALMMQPINGAIHIPEKREELSMDITLEPIMARVLVKKDENFTIENGYLASDHIYYSKGIVTYCDYLFRKKALKVGGVEMEDEHTPRIDQYAHTAYYDAQDFSDYKKAVIPVDLVFENKNLFLNPAERLLIHKAEIQNNFEEIDLLNRYVYFEEWTLKPKFYSSKLNETLAVMADYVPNQLKSRMKKGEGWLSYGNYYMTESEFTQILSNLEAAKKNTSLPKNLISLIEKIKKMDKKAREEDKYLTLKRGFEKNGLKFYFKSTNFYFASIRHFNNLQTSNNEYGKYGIVRGNEYKINLKSISAPGMPYRERAWSSVNHTTHNIHISSPIERDIQDISF